MGCNPGRNSGCSSGMRSCKQKSHGGAPVASLLRPTSANCAAFLNAAGVCSPAPLREASRLLHIPEERGLGRALGRNLSPPWSGHYPCIARARVAARAQLDQHIRPTRGGGQHIAVVRVDDPHVDVGEKVGAGAGKPHRQRPLALRLLQRRRFVEDRHRPTRTRDRPGAGSAADRHRWRCPRCFRRLVVPPVTSH